MLSKVDNSIISGTEWDIDIVNTTEIKDVYISNKQASTTLRTNNTWESVVVNVSVSATNLAWRMQNLQINWTQVATATDSWTNISWSRNWITIANWESVVALVNCSVTSGSNAVKFNLRKVTQPAHTITISKEIITRKSLPRELKTIWNKATSTLYGYHTDNTRYIGE